MQTYLREVARGPKGARDLSYDLAHEAACHIFDGAATAAQVGAFLTALRLKGESVDELLAFAEALRERTKTLTPPDEVSGVLDCSGPYDGRSHSFAATIPVSLLLAAAGVPVVLHGSASLPPKYGVTLADIWIELGLCGARSSQHTPDSVKDQLVRHRLVLLDTEQWCTPLATLRSVREQLGVRTLLNTVEKFLNLAQAEMVVAGVFHGTALDNAAALAARLGYRKALIVQGVDGSEDIPTHRPSAACQVVDGQVEKFVIDPGALGMSAPCPRVELSATEQAAEVRRVLREREHPYRNMVLLNAGLRLWWSGRTNDVGQGVELARELLDSGRAWQTLQSMYGQ
jgi:anthranilate phosphoribosyltransferase